MLDLPTRKVVIIGGSMAGLFAAAFLQRRGFDVEVFERADGLSDRGAGIATHQPLHDALAKAEIQRPDGTGVEIAGRIMFDRDGGLLHRHDMDQIMTSWGLVYRSVRELIPDDRYHNRMSLSAIEEKASSVVAVFEDGQEVEADFLIGADGTWSSTRHCVAPKEQVDYCGYFIWRGLIDENLVPESVAQQVSGRLTFGMAPGGHWLGYLVAGPNDELTPGRRRFNWAWYRPGDPDKLRDLLTDVDGVHHPLGIPHGRIRPEHRDAMRAEAATYLAPQLQAIIGATDTPFLQPIYEYSAKRMVYGRVALIGDAAFTARPHVGIGVSKAADDALALAEGLDQADPAAGLAEFEDSRSAMGRAILRWGQDLGSYCGSPSQDPEIQTKAAYFQRPEVLLSVTAAIDPSAYLDERKE